MSRSSSARWTRSGGSPRGSRRSPVAGTIWQEGATDASCRPGAAGPRKYDIGVDEAQAALPHAEPRAGGLGAFDATDPGIRTALVEELIRANRIAALGRFAPGVQHELNNPLTAIVAFAQLIRRNPDLPADMQRDAELLIDEAERTRRLVETLLNYVRPRPPERHPTRLRPLIDSVTALASYELLRYSITLTVDIPDSVPAVPIDRSLLQQVLLGLVANAIEAVSVTGEPGAIAVQAFGGETPGSVRVTVSDTGPGVDEAIEDDVFEPFVTTKSDRTAAGLGLPVSRAIVEAHGGRLSLGPRAQGRGATFTLELPLGEGAVTTGKPETVEATATTEQAGTRVLVLDDEPSIRRFLEKAIRVTGRDALVATSGSEAVGLAMDPSVGLVICDQRMADMTGIDVYRAIVGRRPDLGSRFVLMTGDVDSVQLRAFAAEHGTPLLAKPFTLDDLATIVREMLPPDDAQSRG